MQGDIAPCGTTDRDAATPLLLPHAGSAFRSPFSSISSISWFLPTCSPFSVWSVFSVDSSHAGSAARSAFLVYFVYFVVSSTCSV